MIIAIDGPAGAGKSTIAKLISKKLGFLYIDTGAIFRVITLSLINSKININYEDELINHLENIDFKYTTNHLFLNGKIVDEEIRTEIISNKTSEYSGNYLVRNYALKFQRELANLQNVVLEGRDIGTIVFPNADYKFYLTASEEIRGIRRHKELTNKGIDISLNDVIQNINERDNNDKNRKIAPLKKAKDAIEIDTTHFDIPEIVSKIINCIKVEE